MKTIHDYPIPVGTKLFDGITREQARELLYAIGAITIAYNKGETIVEQWSKVTHHFLMIDGEVHSYSHHTNGRRSVNGVFKRGDSFGLTFCFSDLRQNPSTAVAVKDSIVIKIPIVEIIKNDILIGFQARRRYIQNCVDIISQSAFKSRLRSFVLEQPTIEDRIRTYLNEKSKHANNSEFEIPLDRQELADFLACDRSSLCSVLTKMKTKGLIDFSRNHFRVIVPAE